MKKLCVLFPGIGYNCDKPLMYYSSKLAAKMGYDTVRLSFSGFDKSSKGNDEKMCSAADHALMQSEEQLESITFTDYDRIVFIGKSIGTAAALMYREKHSINAECIMYTPLEFDFEYQTEGCVFFHGTSDQWADTANIKKLCAEHNVPLHLYENANHSIETGDNAVDLSYLSDVLAKTKEILKDTP